MKWLVFVVVGFTFGCGVTATSTEKVCVEEKIIDLCKSLNFETIRSSFYYQINNEDTLLSDKTEGMIRSIDIDSEEKILFLTFDACGQGGLSDGYDSLLVDFLIREKIPATFFISKRWALKNMTHFQFLKTKAPHIEICNHGTQHIPLSVAGASVYGVKGTVDLQGVFDEVEEASTFFCDELGAKPLLFRSGTACADKVSVDFVNKMGYKMISYSVLGDAGATFKKERISNNILTAKSGDIILMHFNHPESEVDEGVKSAIKKLQADKSVRFARLGEFL